MDHYGWGGMGIRMLLFWALLIAAGVIVLRGVVGWCKTDNGKTARNILEERYAQGDIDRDEFERKKQDLSDHGAKGEQT
jgi:putative membrane protein